MCYRGVNSGVQSSHGSIQSVGLHLPIAEEHFHRRMADNLHNCLSIDPGVGQICHGTGGRNLSIAGLTPETHHEFGLGENMPVDFIE
jgi:hypothetical protein